MNVALKRVDAAMAVAVLAILFGGAAWLLDPANGLKWSIAMFAPTAALAGLEAIRHSRFAACETPQAMRLAKFMLVGASSILVVGLALSVGDLVGVFEDGDRGFRRRVMGVMFGGLMAAYGNRIPKLLTPLDANACEPVRQQARQRFAGRVLVLAGLAYALYWLTLPVDLADTLAMLTWPVAGVTVSVYVLTDKRRSSAA